MSSFATALALLLTLVLLTPVLAIAEPTLVPEPAPCAEQLSPGRDANTPSSFGNFDHAKTNGFIGNPTDRMAPRSFGNSARAPPTRTLPADHAEFVQ